MPQIAATNLTEKTTSNAGFDPVIFGQLAEIEGDSFWFKGRNKIICWALQKFFPSTHDFLEIGCGTGFVLTELARTFPSMKLSGSELFEEGLEFAAKRLPEANLFQLDATNIPFEKSFDVIGAFDVLEHIEDDSRVLQQMHKAVRPGGGILLTVPQHMFLWSQSDDFAHHCRRYEISELVRKVENAGFKIVVHTSFVSLLLPLMMLSRLRQKLFPTDYNVISELKVVGIVGAMLEAILKLELTLIKMGISFPAGGSILMVARRV
ncbi:MAG: class I SAM-dependent methyltransferase [Cyanobacteria bacterium SZAS-4]|nr:class I SAM-dependent methyltransferase [Cyanobacteria bacterium SZAS-4]